MDFPIDRSQIIGIFASEASEHLDKLNQGILHLEKHPKDVEIIAELFREAHSLKGAAATVGFNEIRDASHEVEDIFGAIREKKVKFTSKTANQVFNKLDIIKDLLEEALGSDEPEKAESPPEPEAIPEPEKAPPLPAEDRTVPAPREKASGPAKPAKKAGSRASGRGPAPVEEYIRVPLRRINTLLNLGGELIINKIKSTQKLSSFRKAIKDARSLQKRLAVLGEQLKDEVDEKALRSVLATLHQCNRESDNIRSGIEGILEDIQTEALHVDPIIDELQQHIKEIRMLPCSTLFATFPRMVRDIAMAQGKEIEFRIEGEETELDKKVLEGLKDPLIHVLRNAIDHGIEPPEEREAAGKPRAGTIVLSAFHQGANVVIEVRDDGRGLNIARIEEVARKKGLASEEELERMGDREKMNLVFMTGFSTSEFITDVSGRGVGMDVVRSRIESLKGRVEILSEKGAGSTIHAELPLTVAIIHILLVKSGGRKFGIPLSAVEEMAKVSRKEIQTVKNKMAFELRGHTVAIVRLDEVLEMPRLAGENGGDLDLINIVIVESLYGKIGFVVDSLLGREEIYIKSLGTHLGKLRNVTGATVLGTGEIILILDPADLVISSKMTLSGALARKAEPKTEEVRKNLLVVEDSLTTRELMRSILEADGYRVDTAMDGLDGMEKVAQKGYDLIVSDLEMPRMSGLEFCQSLKGNDAYKDIPFVFVTARGNEEEKRRGIEVGAQAYITKGSFDQKNLLNTIRRLL